MDLGPAPDRAEVQLLLKEEGDEGNVDRIRVRKRRSMIPTI